MAKEGFNSGFRGQAWVMHVQYTRTESDRQGYATVRLTGSPIARH